MDVVGRRRSNSAAMSWVIKFQCEAACNLGCSVERKLVAIGASLYCFAQLVKTMAAVKKSRKFILFFINSSLAESLDVLIVVKLRWKKPSPPMLRTNSVRSSRELMQSPRRFPATFQQLAIQRHLLARNFLFSMCLSVLVGMSVAFQVNSPQLLPQTPIAPFHPRQCPP